jgi:hypothetical protein
MVVHLYPQVGYRHTVTSMPVRILSKPLPTLANPTSHHGSNQGVIPHNQGVPHTERTPTPWSPAHQMVSRLTSGVYAKPLPHTTVEWLYDDLGHVRCHATRSLTTRWTTPNMLNHTGTSSPILLTHTSIPSTQFFTHFPKYPSPVFKALTHF